VALRNRRLYKTADELRLMIAPGRLTAAALAAVRQAIVPGITTLELDAIAEQVIRAGGGVPNFMKEPGYSHTVCASVNDEIVHGVPGSRVIVPGDLVSIDCGAELGGWNGDAAFSLVVPDPDRPDVVSRRQQLSRDTEHSLWAGIAALASARRLNEVGGAIEDALAGIAGYGIVEDYTGHGIGRSMHEDPPVFNYRVRGSTVDVRPGLVVAIEPMVTLGGIGAHVLEDGWTVATDDGLDAAHWEHSIAVHSGGIWVLTACDGGASNLAPFGVEPVAIT
jgi:methionyl aminopeptidase